MNDETTTAPDRISDYERAVCYYTLPHATGRVTLALILVYTLCLFEALAALIYGLYADNRTWTVAGTVALAGIVILGVVAFSVRSLMSEVRRRRALMAAQSTPDAPPEADDLPDPFTDHILLTRPLQEEEDFEIRDRDGRLECRVHIEDATRHVLDADGRERLRITVESTARSFVLESMLPRRARVYAGESLVGRMKQRFTFGAPVLEIEQRGARPGRCTLREGGIYTGPRLVGRIYLLRDRLFLDVERAAFNEALLGAFVALSYAKARSSLF